MAIGLNTQELVQAFFESLRQRQGELSLENTLEGMGLSPAWAAIKAISNKVL